MHKSQLEGKMIDLKVYTERGHQAKYAAEEAVIEHAGEYSMFINAKTVIVEE